MMVQVMVHVRAAGGKPINPPLYELLECTPETTVLDLKKQVHQIGESKCKFRLPPGEQELVFMGERCVDSATLADYGVSEPWIVQVAGFVINPEEPGRRFRNGELVPISD